MEKKLAAYALAGGAALLSATPAQAALIVITPDTPIAISVATDEQPQQYLLDMDSDGVDDFGFFVLSLIDPDPDYPGQFDSVLVSGLDYNYIAGTTDGCNCYPIATRFTTIPGALASNPTLYKAKLLSRYTYDGVPELYGNWENSLASRGLIGVNFLLGNSVPVQGFIDVSVEFGSASLTIHQWGWDTDAPVPEPSTMAMFALGAVGIAALRRRRNQQQTQ
jgi:hypothetical protein